MFQILVYFLCKSCNPPLSQQLPSKKRDPVKPPIFFENLVGNSTPPPSKKVGGGGGGVHSMNFHFSSLLIITPKLCNKRC